MVPAFVILNMNFVGNQIKDFSLFCGRMAPQARS
jgi:hypothetical protein